MIMWEAAKQAWRQGGMLTRIVWVNVAVFVAVTTANLMDRWSGGSLSAVVPQDGVWTLATSWRVDVLAKRPWSVLTHMVTHEGLWHLLMNMILLFWVGRVVAANAGSRRLLSLYVGGGLAGFLAYFLLSNGLRPMQGGTYAVGASGAVMALFAAAATLQPNTRFNLILFGPLPLKTLFWAYLLLDYFALSQGTNPGGNVAHLGGALFGVLVVKQEARGVNLLGWLEWLLDAVSTGTVSVPRRKRSRFRASTSNRWKAQEREASRAPMSDDEFNADRADREARLNAILDKISKHGYDHLSPEEKRFLFDQSQR